MNDDNASQMPKARTERLIIKELPEETLVYDLDSDRAYCLNASAHAVWKRCDGAHSAGDISRSVAHETGADVDESVVWLALDQLQKHKLLTEAPNARGSFAGLARRRVIRTLGAGALAMPLIVSVVVPTAQAQASPCSLPVGRPAGCPCTADTQCLSNGTPGGGCNTGQNKCK